jgi:DNA invertase Pin-like site-specific DNA recombinase
MINLMTTIAQYKRDLLLERQRERIEVAKKPIKYKGRQRVKKQIILMNVIKNMRNVVGSINILLNSLCWIPV